MAFVPFVLQLFACLVVTAAISPAQPAPRMAAYISRTIGLFAVCSMFVFRPFLEHRCHRGRRTWPILIMVCFFGVQDVAAIQIAKS